MPARSSSEAVVTELPTQPPKVLQEAHQPGKINPLTPALKTPLSSEIAKAVIDCAPLIPREHIAKVLENKAPHLAAMVRSCGEVDPDADPHQEFFHSLVAMAAINYGRKIYDINSPVLVKAEGQESANFVQTAARAGVEVEI